MATGKTPGWVSRKRTRFTPQRLPLKRVIKFLSLNKSMAHAIKAESRLTWSNHFLKVPLQKGAILNALLKTYQKKPHRSTFAIGVYLNDSWRQWVGRPHFYHLALCEHRRYLLQDQLTWSREVSHRALSIWQLSWKIDELWIKAEEEDRRLLIYVICHQAISGPPNFVMG